MTRRHLFGWTVRADADLTRTLYDRVEIGAALRCGCAACLNFDRARPRGYPKDFLDLLVEVGIDARKEHEVRLVTPLTFGRGLYAGTYLFAGELITGRPYRGFPFLREEVDVFEPLGSNLHLAFRPWDTPPGPWTGGPCVRIEFLAVLPWGGAAPGIDLDRSHCGFTA